LNAVSVFERAVSRYSGRLFAFDQNTSITYEQASDRVSAIARHLQHLDVQPGDAIAFCSRDSLDLFLAIIGSWYVGALPSLIDPRTSMDDLPYFVDNISPRIAIAEPGQSDRLRSVGATDVMELQEIESSPGTLTPQHDESSLLYLSYTSGTTGDPKGAVLRSGPVALGTACIAERLGLTRHDILLATTPTSSSFQLVAALLPAIHVGAAVGFVAGSSIDDVWDTAITMHASVLVAYPLTLSDVVNAPQATSQVSPFRLALSGGSPLSPRIKRDYLERLGIPLVESYGQSELGGFMALGRPDGDTDESGFVGLPLPDRLALVAGADGNELPAGEVGEVIVPSGYFDSYWNKPEETERTLAGGFLHCGDLAVSDEDGRLKVLGRTREAARSMERGFFLRELEDAYYEHEAVQHAVVVEDEAGKVRAFVELRGEYKTTEDELETLAAARSGHQADSMRLLEAMPRTFSGKANRLSLSSSESR
jgi:long-chain acyl-CoA synthetase